jgi:hypothetical protein
VPRSPGLGRLCTMAPPRAMPKPRPTERTRIPCLTTPRARRGTRAWTRDRTLPRRAPVLSRRQKSARARPRARRPPGPPARSRMRRDRGRRSTRAPTWTTQAPGSTRFKPAHQLSFAAPPAAGSFRAFRALSTPARSRGSAAIAESRVVSRRTPWTGPRLLPRVMQFPGDGQAFRSAPAFVHIAPLPGTRRPRTLGICGMSCDRREGVLSNQSEKRIGRTLRIRGSRTEAVPRPPRRSSLSPTSFRRDALREEW